MGKNKYATKKGSIFTEKSHSSESEYEKLVAYAEKMGKQIWEVTEEDLKNDKNEEENEEQEDENEDKQIEQEINDVKNEENIIKASIIKKISGLLD